MITASTDPTTTEPAQATIADVRRTITTKAGFRLRVPIAHVSGETREPGGAVFRVVWRNAEQLLQAGHNVRVRTPRGGRLTFRYYRRHITAAMVHALGRLKAYHQRHGDDGFAHLKDFGGPKHGDWARLRHWGLIEARPSADPRCKTDRGWWRLTGLGHCWLRGTERIPREVAVLEGLEVGFVDAHDLIAVADADPTFDLAAVLGQPSGRGAA